MSAREKIIITTAGEVLPVLNPINAIVSLVVSAYGYIDMDEPSIKLNIRDSAA